MGRGDDGRQTEARMRRILPILVLLAPLPAGAQDAAEGRRLAEQWCAH